MGLQSALATALTGLNAAETTIDVVGNNVSNSQTVGFKESNVNFATQFLQTISIGAAPSSSSGGTNPRQVGLGAKVSEITPDFTQGTIEISSNELDVAIQGDGFLLVQGSQGELYYTRNGQLSTNQDNEVVTSEGYRVLGFNAVDGEVVESLQPITIPIGGSQVNQVTENVTFSGTLSPQATVGTAGEITSEVFGDGSVEQPDPTGSFGIDDILTTPSINMSSFGGAPAGVGAVPLAGTYSYVVTFIDGFGNETPASNAGSVTTGTNGNIDLSGLPVPTGDYVDRNIYRMNLTTGDYQLIDMTGHDPLLATFTDVTAEASLGATLDNDTVDVGTYSYYITYYDSGNQVETRPTAEIGTVSVTETNQRIRLENLPQPVDPDFDRIRIYRNDGTGTHRMVAEVADGTTVYMDSTSNADLASADEIDLDGNKLTAADPTLRPAGPRRLHLQHAVRRGRRDQLHRPQGRHHPRDEAVGHQCKHHGAAVDQLHQRRVGYQHRRPQPPQRQHRQRAACDRVEHRRGELRPDRPERLRVHTHQHGADRIGGAELQRHLPQRRFAR